MKIIIKFMSIILCFTVLFLSCSPDPDSPPIEPTTPPNPTPAIIPTLPTPVISPNTTDTELFINYVLELTASGSGENVTYNWSTIGGGSFDIENLVTDTTGATVIYKAPSMPGTVTISCSAIDESGAISAEASISYTLYNMTDSVIWLDAMDPGTFVPVVGENIVNGMGIVFWNDKSGNGNNANNGLTGVPIYFTDMVNGRPAVRFHDASVIGTFPYFNISGSSSLDFSNITFFVIARQSGTDTVNGHENHTIMKMDSGFSLSANTDNTTFYFTINDEGSVSFPNSLIADYAVIAGVYDQTAKVLGVWIDGALVASATYDNVMDSSGNFHIGGNGVNGVLEGYLGEVIVFDKALSDDQIVFISSYLYGKWGWGLVPPGKNVSRRLR